MIETGDFENQEFLGLLEEFSKSDKFDISHLLITHAHHDHFGGLNSVLEKFRPKCYKMLTDNIHERQVFEKFPLLRDQVSTIENGQTW